jgi:hypothetical protein
MLVLRDFLGAFQRDEHPGRLTASRFPQSTSEVKRVSMDPEAMPLDGKSLRISQSLSMGIWSSGWLL